LQGQRDQLEAKVDGDERRQRLAALSQRIVELEARLASAVLVEPGTQSADVVRFGATVTLLTDDGEERRYRIVGVDEADAAQGLVSFLAPIARAMLGRQVDDVISLNTARGTETLEIVAISYDADE
jgi:transcription elongation factor GreB